MQVKLSNQTLLNSLNTLTKLNQLELPIKVAFIVLKNTKEIEKEMSNYYDAREKLVKQCAILDVDGKPIPDEYGNLQLKDGCSEKWNLDIRELLDIKINVKLQAVSVNELFKTELSMSPSELSTIEFMIKD